MSYNQFNAPKNIDPLQELKQEADFKTAFSKYAAIPVLPSQDTLLSLKLLGDSDSELRTLASEFAREDAKFLKHAMQKLSTDRELANSMGGKTTANAIRLASAYRNRFLEKEFEQSLNVDSLMGRDNAKQALNEQAASKSGADNKVEEI